MILYPYYLFVLTQGGEASLNDLGEFEPKAPLEWVFHSMCRDVIGGAGRKIQSASGENIVYSSLVTMPLGTAPLHEGTKVIVSQAPDNPQLNKRVEGTVLNFHSSRLHCRLWV